MFQQYAMTATGINTNDMMDVDAVDNTFKRPYITHKTSKQKHETNGGKSPSFTLSTQYMNLLCIGWWISEHYVDRFLTTEAERIERKLFSGVSHRIDH